MLVRVILFLLASGATAGGDNSLEWGDFRQNVPLFAPPDHKVRIIFMIVAKI